VETVEIVTVHLTVKVGIALVTVIVLVLIVVLITVVVAVRMVVNKIKKGEEMLWPVVADVKEIV
jgi:hypothetical protein